MGSQDDSAEDIQSMKQLKETLKEGAVQQKAQVKQKGCAGFSVLEGSLTVCMICIYCLRKLSYSINAIKLLLLRCFMDDSSDRLSQKTFPNGSYVLIRAPGKVPKSMYCSNITEYRGTSAVGLCVCV